MLSEEAWNEVCHELNIELNWEERRLNLLIRGLDFKTAIGKFLLIGSVVLEVAVETRPCSRMDAVLSGLKNRLIPHMRGGLGCRVISGGIVAIGETAILQMKTT